MHPSSLLPAVTFLVMTPLIPQVLSIPVTTTAPDPCTPDNFPNCNQPPETSVYFCENINWQPPCYVFPLGRNENGAQYNWKDNHIGSPWPDQSWTVGSLGPAQGIKLFIENQYDDNSSTLFFPGQSDVGTYWRDNIYTFVASWDPGTSTKMRGLGVETEELASSSNAEVNAGGANY